MNVHLFRKKIKSCDENEQLEKEIENLKSSPTVSTKSLKSENDNLNKRFVT